VLVLLDNCEHLLEESSTAVETLLHACPDLTFLCTSREPLQVPGGAVWTLGPLPLPGPDDGARPELARRSEAMQLLLDRVSLHHPEFCLDATNSWDVVQLCRQLDGIPLAIELAAARIGLMSFGQVLGHLEGRLGRPRPRRSRPGAAPGRHETIWATIDWSYELLTDAERRLLRRLSVFRGGFTAEGAAAVLAAGPDTPAIAFDLLIRLVQKSLVQPIPPRRERYRCLELIRRYAADRLGESGEEAAARRLHFEHYFALAEQAAEELTSTDQRVWLELLAAEHDNFRAALEFGCDEDLEHRLRFVLALDRFWRSYGYVGEAREWAEDVLEEPADAAPAPLRARVLTAAAGFAWRQGDLATAADYSERSLAVWSNLGDSRGRQCCLTNLGVIAWASGDLETARRRYLESLALARAAGDARAVAVVLTNLGLTTADLGDQDEARGYLDEALRLMQELDDPNRVAVVLASLGALDLHRGRHELAREHYTESLRMLASLGARQNVAECLEGLACVAAQEGRPARAVRLAGAAAGVREVIGVVSAPSWQRLLDAWIAIACDALGRSSGQIWKEGCRLSEREAIALALTESDPSR
jgi:predicted ATPase